MHLNLEAQTNFDHTLNRRLREILLERFSQFKPTRANNSKLRHAAVVIAILADNKTGNASILLTRRPLHLRHHAGQYALPGGRLEPNESPVEASLRELKEEVGISLSKEAVIGRLDDYETRSGFRISPVVVWAGVQKEIHPDPNEVAVVFRIPFEDLMSPQIPHLEPSADGEHPVLSIPIKTIGHRVYAPTAVLIYQFREIALFNRHTRVAHYDQPKFAWS